MCCVQRVSDMRASGACSAGTQCRIPQHRERDDPADGFGVLAGRSACPKLHASFLHVQCVCTGGVVGFGDVGWGQHECLPSLMHPVGIPAMCPGDQDLVIDFVTSYALTRRLSTFAAARVCCYAMWRGDVFSGCITCTA